MVPSIIPLSPSVTLGTAYTTVPTYLPLVLASGTLSAYRKFLCYHLFCCSAIIYIQVSSFNSVSASLPLYLLLL